MINFLLLMTVPMLIAFGVIFFFRKRVTLGELAIQLAVPAVLLALGLCISYWQRATDTEIWNGKVLSKEGKKVSCEHSYQCNCVTTCTGGKHNSCTTICQTCYEHSYDISWYVYSTSNQNLTINRVDRQGLTMPPRWAAVYVGEPFSSEHSYTNYILANPDSVLLGGKGDIERFKNLLPSYPRVYDYYKANHVINMGGVPVEDPYSWEWLLSEVNAELGPVRQVNIILLFVKTDDPAYTLALKDHWVGGKKNDVVVVIGSLDGRKISFADVVSWTPNELYRVKLRDSIQFHGRLDRRDEIINNIKRFTLTEFQRMHMKDYEYLVRSFQPSNGAMIFLFILGSLASIGLAFWSVNNHWDCEMESPSRTAYNSYYNRYYR